MASVLTAVLQYHLAWVSTVMPAGAAPSRAYLDKHSSKTVSYFFLEFFCFNCVSLSTFLTHPWEPCQANHHKPDLYSHNNNSFTQCKCLDGRSKHELAKNQEVKWTTEKTLECLPWHVTWHPQNPAVCEKNIFHLCCSAQPMENQPYMQYMIAYNENNFQNSLWLHCLHVRPECPNNKPNSHEHHTKKPLIPEQSIPE